jgi:hypothetical protein
MRKTTAQPDVVDRPTTKGKTKSGDKAGAPRGRAAQRVSPKASPKQRILSKQPKPGSSRSGKDNTRGPRVRAATGKANPRRKSR